MTRTREAYNTLKEEYDGAKTLYDALYKKDNEEGLTEEEYTQLDELESNFNAKKEELESKKAILDEK